MSDYNEKVKSKSHWITKELLEPVLQTAESNKEIKVENVSVRAAVGAGDNYVSVLYKTTISCEKNESENGKVYHLMIKGPPTGEFMLKMIEDMGIFLKETTMYNKCLPLMKDLHTKYFPGGTDFFAPQSYLTDLSNVIIMEDISYSGYKMSKRQNQLDFKHSCATMKCVARFHALSLKIKLSNVDWFDTVSKEMYAPDNKQMAAMFENVFPMFASNLEEWTGNSNWSDKLRKISENCYDKLVRLVEPKEGKFNVLNHGDLWVNNMLYKYDEESNIEHVKLVDYQLSRYSSPVLDMIYFFFSSVRPEVLSENMFQLVEVYHNSLNQDLISLNLEHHSPTLEELKNDLKNHSFFCIIVISTLLPIIVSEAQDALDMDTVTEEQIMNVEGADNPFLDYYKTPAFKERVCKYLKFLEDVEFLQSAVEYQ